MYVPAPIADESRHVLMSNQCSLFISARKEKRSLGDYKSSRGAVQPRFTVNFFVNEIFAPSSTYVRSRTNSLNRRVHLDYSEHRGSSPYSSLITIVENVADTARFYN